MFKFKRVGFRECAVWTLFVMVSNVQASGVGSVMGTGGASEMTQMMNNFQLGASVTQQVQTVSNLVRVSQLNYGQLQQQLLAGLRIEGVQLSDVNKSLGDMSKYQSSLKSVGLDVGNLDQVFKTRLAEARLQNLTPEQYAQSQSDKINAGNVATKARLDNERAQVQRANDDMTLAQTYGDRIPATAGVHEAIGLMNSQMNLLIQQMSRLLTMTAQQQGSDKAIAQNKAAAQEQSQESLGQSILEMQQKQKTATRAAVDSIKNRISN